MGKPRALIVGAVQEEIDPCTAACPGQFAAAVVGIGAVEAACRMTTTLGSTKPSFVLFVGSVGAYSRNLSLLSFACASRVLFSDAALLEGRAFTPDTMNPPHPADKRLSEVIVRQFAQCSFQPILTVPSITRDPEFGEKLANTSGAAFESLELYGVASACVHAGVPWASLGCITNYTGPDGHDEWLANRFKAAELTAEAVSKLAESLFGS